jgi:fluoride exporter
MKHSLIVFLGSGLGGVARHVLNHFVTSIAGSGFPWGILMINTRRASSRFPLSAD